MDDFSVQLTAVLALIAGSCAGMLSLLSWRLFRDSPFGKVLLLLAIVMSLHVIYHALLMLVDLEGQLVLQLLKSAIHTGIAAIVLIIIALHYRLGAPTDGGIR